MGWCTYDQVPKSRVTFYKVLFLAPQRGLMVLGVSADSCSFLHDVQGTTLARLLVASTNRVLFVGFGDQQSRSPVLLVPVAHAGIAPSNKGVDICGKTPSFKHLFLI
jgi:hypothetical protein